MKNYLIGFTILISLLTSCKPSEMSSDYLDEAVELTAVEVFSSSPYRASRTRTIDIIHTDLKVSFDWEKQYLIGEAIITLKPYFYATDEAVLDAKGMEIKSVSLKGDALNSSLNYIYENDALTIDLGKKYLNTDTLNIMISYVARPEERATHAGSAVTDDKGLYFINPLGENPDKPQQLWTQGETEANSVWFPTIDSPNERCTHQIAMTVDQKFVTLANGDLVSSVANADGTRTDVWAQKNPIAPYLFMMAVSEFAVVKDSINGMEVNYYVDKDYEPYAKDIFNNTTEMITFYSELLGYDYPWSKYSQVIVHDYVSGAMENVGAVIFGDFVHQTKREMIDGNNESTVAHELFHHWFGDVVTCESWSNLPLNESFATYGEYLWYEYKYGVLTADAVLQNDLDSYLSEVKHGDAKDMIRFHYNKPDDMFDSHSYSKGGRILHMLRTYVGDDAFFASLKLYLHDNEFTSVEIHQLRLAFEEVTGEDLNWFFNQWFMGKGHPDLDITYTYDEASMTQSVLVEQLQDIEDYALFKLPVEIDIYVGGKKETHSIIVDSVKQTFSFKVSAKPDLVNFDSKKVLLCTKTENHSMAEMAFMYENAPLYKDKREAVLFAYNEEVELDAAKKLIRKAMTDEAKSIRVLAISKYDMFEENDVDVQKVLISVLQNDPNSEARYEATFALSDLFIDADEMVNVFESQLKTDSSYLVISGLLGSIAVADSTLGLKYAKQFETEDNSDILYSCAEVYSVYGNESNYDFFIDLYPKSESYEVMSFLMYCQDYLMLIDAPEKQPAMLDIYEKEAKSELAWFVRYYAVSGLVNLKEHYISMAKMNRKDANEDKAMLYDELVERIDADLTSLRVTETDNRVFMQR